MSPTPARPRIVLTDPRHFEVSYVINPWMRPDAWDRDPAGNRRAARAAWDGLAAALALAGADIEVVEGAPGLPDMVFPANSAIVMDGRALLSRFLHPERRPEEARFLAAYRRLQARGLLDEVAEMPEGLHQEGAGDCHWDPVRRHFWMGWGQRSSRASVDHVAAFFGCPAVPLELVSPRFYHLDVCFYPLSGGEVVFYPGAFSEASRSSIRERVPADLLIEAGEEEAGLLCLNAVNIGRDVVMATGTPRLRAALAERGYRCLEVDLSPFMLSGGAAYCMTLRLDLESGRGRRGALRAAG